MLSTSTVRGNGPNFTLPTVFQPAHGRAVLLSLRAAHSLRAGDRRRLRMVYIAPTSATLTACLTHSCHTTLTIPLTKTALPAGEKRSTRWAEERLQHHSRFALTVRCYYAWCSWSAAQSLPTLPYHHLWLPNGLHSENLTHFCPEGCVDSN